MATYLLYFGSIGVVVTLLLGTVPVVLGRRTPRLTTATAALGALSVIAVLLGMVWKTDAFLILGIGMGFVVLVSAVGLLPRRRSS